MYNDLYYDFKRENDLTDTEILDKNVSLRGVQKCLTVEENIQLMKNVGFKNMDIFLKYNNFVGIIAIK
jgi:tRNA (cmo5U34)-methyltransferase